MKIMVIDGNSLVNRAFYGVRLLSNREGFYTNAIYGFLNTYLKLSQEAAPDYTCVCFDLKAPTFRHNEFENYKAQRKAMPEELAMQIPVLKEALDLLGLPRFELEGYEADDLIGTISKRVTDAGHECLVVTGDKDTLQLIGGGVTVKIVSTRMGQTLSTDYDRERFFEEYNLEPSKIVDIKALSGDPSDNYPGVKGIGDKTALELILKFGSLDGIYENINSDQIREKLREKLIDGKDMAYLSYRLALIDQNAPLEFDLHKLAGDRNDEGLLSLFARLEFKNLGDRFGLQASDREKKPEKEAAKALPTQNAQAKEKREELLRLCRAAAHIALSADFELENLAVCTGTKIYTVALSRLSPAERSEFLRNLFAEDIRKVMHDAKNPFQKLMDEGVSPEGLLFDTAVADYLLNPSQNDYSLEKCALSYLGIRLEEDSEVPTLFEAEDRALTLAAKRAEVILSLYEMIRPQIAEMGMEALYFDIELPLISVLASMQHYGFRIDEETLLHFGKELSAATDVLTEKIYAAAGEEFNINSTKKLAEILFEKLGLAAAKKTKTGYSTDIEVLKALRGKHEIIDYIIDYRQLSKLKSTYVDGLSKVICHEDGRIHSNFNQMVTVTGRLSSTEPNLQNIPVRQELGSEIRRMFIPREGFCLLDADYSQIELRILAHIANDETMIEAFREEEDIHAVTASQVFGVSLTEVTALQRRRAKAVNFGIVYGISDFSLSEDIGVSRSEARQYIENYLEKYSGVRKYMEDIRNKAKEEGFVVTMFGRRRYLPELKSTNYNIRSFGERAALNTPIQGTAADIIKIAMVNVYNRLKREKLKSRLILQVHDELIIEAEKSEAAYVKRLLKEEMEHAADLRVPLTAEVTEGNNWYEAKK